VLRKNIEAWVQYEKTLLDYISGTRPSESWEEKALETIEHLREGANESSRDLKELRKSFQVILERVTVMRDGVSPVTRSLFRIFSRPKLLFG
jgi:hypothetical protein